MPRPLLEVLDRLRNRRPARRATPPVAAGFRPCLEALEDRRLLTTTSVVPATGVLSGLVDANGGTTGVPGVGVTLTGTTTTGRTVDVTTTTGAGGNYSFTQLLPGSYSVSPGVSPSDFVGGNAKGISGITLGAGQSKGGINFGVGGLGPDLVTLEFFVSGHPVSSDAALPPAGPGSAAGFSLDSANPLHNQTLVNGSTVFLDLAANFFDPNTTDTTVTFNTSQGSFNVKLLDTAAPQTVTNFLDYVAAGDYSNDLFHRLSNLSQTTAQNPPLTPFQVLQGGGFTVNSNGGNVTGFTTLTTFQPIKDEFNPANPDAIGTLALAMQSTPNSGTSQFFFNLTDNSQALNASNNGGFAVFGKVVSNNDLTTLQKFASNYNPTDVSTATGNSAFVTVPLLKGFTPASNFPTGASTSDLAVINSITPVAPPTGHLTYQILSNSNPSVVTVTLGQNTSTSTFDANQLKLVAGSKAGSAVITVQVTDAKGEAVTKQFTVTVL